MVHGLQPFATLDISLPAQLVWLGSAAVPLVLAWLALRDPRRLRWAATEFLARAARRQHLSRGGLPLPLTLLRMLMLAMAAVAAARPLLTTSGLPSVRQQAARGAPAAAVPAARRIEIVAGGSDAQDRPHLDPDRAGVPPAAGAALAIGRAIEAVAESAPGRLAVSYHGLPAAGRGPLAAPTVIILCDGSVPLAGDAARIGRAVGAGAGLLVCIGPRSLEEGHRQRLSAWLDTLIGVTVEGRIDLDAADVDVASDLAVDIGGPILGPTVSAAAELALPDGDRVAILARTAGGRPLIVSRSHGRGRVCVSALPMTLPLSQDTGEPAAVWSDLAAWPVFVPLLDRLLDRLPAVGLDVPRGAARAPAALPLAPLLLTVAAGLALAEWLLASRMVVGSVSNRDRSAVQRAGRVGIVAALAGLLATSFQELPPPTAPARQDRGPRPVALLIDASPSMGSRDVRGRGQGGPPVSRLESLRDGLMGATAGAGPLDRIADEHVVMVSTVAGEITLLGRYRHDVMARDLQALAPAAPAVGASPLGDAILAMLGGGGDDERGGAGTPVVPAAIVIASDGLITAGASWSVAAGAAADHGVPLIVVPVGNADSAAPPAALPPGFRLVSVSVPRLCRESEPTAVEVEAEATIGGGPLPVSIFAPPSTRGRPLATGTLTAEPDVAAADATATPRRFSGRLVLPPHSLGSGPAAMRSLLLHVGTLSDAGTAADAAVMTTVSLAVTDAAIEALLIDAVPRYEWRFLEQLLSATAGVEPQTCLLTSATTAGLRPGSPLPDSAAAWNRFDVVVIGDLPRADGGGSMPPVPPRAWEELRSAAVERGLGIAWIPGPRWWEDRGGGIDWLPAAAVGPASVPATLPAVLRATPGGLESGWIGWAADAEQPEVLALLRPVTLRPTARVLATASASDGGPQGMDRLPAVIIDRLGSAGMLGHLCETWRWRRGDPRRYEEYWRRAIGRLAEPHLIGRLFAATLDRRPAVIRTGDRVRIDVVPTRATTDLAGWRVELSTRPAATADEGMHATAERNRAGARSDPPANARRLMLLPAPGGPGRTATITLDRLATGFHAVRLLPPESGSDDLPTATVQHEFVVSERSAETVDGPAAVGPLAAVARATGGSVVPIGSLAELPAAVATAIAAAERRGGAVEQRPEGGDRSARSRMSHLLMAGLVVSCVVAWWQPRPARRHRETS